MKHLEKYRQSIEWAKFCFTKSATGANFFWAMTEGILNVALQDDEVNDAEYSIICKLITESRNEYDAQANEL